MPHDGTSRSFTVKPKDERFAETEYKTHQVSSNPFRDKTMKKELPIGVLDVDVEQIISVGVKPGDDSLLTLDLIETKDGEVFLKRDSAVQFLQVTKFEPPVFSLCMRFGVGVTGAVSGGQGAVSSERWAVRFSPMVSVSLAEWNVARLNFLAPTLIADLNGIGAGAQVRVYHDIYLGVVREWGRDGGTEVKGVVGVVW